ncbi:capsid protein [Sewage-associated gemycircularvirus 9]|uniref:Capsid protein n=1 Tax=sewage derived gemycircularvirus 5 TaxID=1985411 RepID=A0A0A7CL54_9VIRU|nr:capsid protein [Sewage-associated gemycircularvirus 9]AIF34839.1 capsid protein [Sewage-associated gemycircularvirus 9]
MRRSRRFPAKRRFTRRKTTYRRPRRTITKRSYRSRRPMRRMTRKSILNTTSTKKRDTMIAGNTFPALPENVGALTVTSDVPAVLLWCPTARQLADTRSALSTMPVNAQRLSSTPFIVGLKETITIRTDTSNAWRWRRIVFFLKGGPPGFTDVGDINRVYSPVNAGTDFDTYQRTATALPFALVADVYASIFRGFGINNVSATPQDWLDPITAPIDTSRITPVYDHTTSIRSGNDTGVVKTTTSGTVSGRHSTNNDSEIGGNMLSSAFSTHFKPGCGDMYVMDIIIGNSAESSDALQFLPTSTLYWHEK